MSATTEYMEYHLPLIRITYWPAATLQWRLHPKPSLDCWGLLCQRCHESSGNKGHRVPKTTSQGHRFLRNLHSLPPPRHSSEAIPQIIGHLVHHLHQPFGLEDRWGIRPQPSLHLLDHSSHTHHINVDEGLHVFLKILFMLLTIIPGSDRDPFFGD